MLDIARIRIDGDTQARVGLNLETVADYADAYRNGVSMPPVVVFFDGSDYWLADGFHRYHGAQNAGISQIYEEIIPGTKRDAILYSLGANCKHGLRRTKEDKRKAVVTLLQDPEWSTWSQERIAKAAGVSTGFVSRLVNDASLHGEEMKPAVRTVVRDGKEYKQDTSRIGKATERKDETAALGAPIKQPGKSTAAATEEEVPEYLGPSEDEIRQAELAQEDEISAFRAILAADDKLAAAMSEIKRLQALVRTLESTRDAYMNGKNEAIQKVKSLQAKLTKLEKQIGGAAA